MGLLLVLWSCQQDCPLWYPDEDGDGFGSPYGEALAACDPKDAPGHVDNTLDCHDFNASIHPEAEEVCDPEGVDEDCDGLVDDEDDAPSGQLVSWADTDGDGFGDPLAELHSCVV